MKSNYNLIKTISGKIPYDKIPQLKNENEIIPDYLNFLYERSYVFYPEFNVSPEIIYKRIRKLLNKIDYLLGYHENSIYILNNYLDSAERACYNRIATCNRAILDAYKYQYYIKNKYKGSDE